MSSIKLSVGNKWTSEFLNSIFFLNDQYSKNDIEITELYGSFKNSVVGLNSARPNFLLPKLKDLKAQKFIKRAHVNGVKINYTINAPLNITLEEIHDNYNIIVSELEKIIEMGVDVLTISNSLLLMILKDIIDIPIEISSILQTRSTSQIPIYKDFGVAKVCMNVVNNRDFLFLKNYAEYASKYNIHPKLIVNEFCSYNGAPCVGIMQNDCIINSSLGGNKKHHFGGWPFSYCSASRHDPVNLLKSKFILPQWLEMYKSITGIEYFKITGRTCNSEWLLSAIESYMKKTYYGDIRLLWREPINRQSPTLNDSKDYFITGEGLGKINFLNKWIKNPNFRCDENCGIHCDYCETIVNRMRQNNFQDQM